MSPSLHKVFIFGGGALMAIGLYKKETALVVAGGAVVAYGVWMRMRQQTPRSAGTVNQANNFSPPQSGSLNAGVPDSLNLGGWASKLTLKFPSTGDVRFGSNAGNVVGRTDESDPTGFGLMLRPPSF